MWKGGELVLSSLLSLGRKSAAAKSAAPKAPPPAPEPPPLLPEERNGNLTVLERDLNAAMACPAGRNQVFIRSVVTKHGTTPPRIALKCSLRRDIGQPVDVFLEHVRSVCCADPKECEAYRKFKDRFVQT